MCVSFLFSKDLQKYKLTKKKRFETEKKRKESKRKLTRQTLSVQYLSRKLLSMELARKILYVYSRWVIKSKWNKMTFQRDLNLGVIFLKCVILIRIPSKWKWCHWCKSVVKFLFVIFFFEHNSKSFNKKEWKNISGLWRLLTKRHLVRKRENLKMNDNGI